MITAWIVISLIFIVAATSATGFGGFIGGIGVSAVLFPFFLIAHVVFSIDMEDRCEDGSEYYYETCS